jgi:hypothetical protein
MKMIFYTFILLMLVSCETHIVKTYHALNSWSIKESKNKNLFSHSYAPGYIHINDSIDFYIENAWCEKTYYHGELKENGKLNENLKREPLFHLVIILKENLEKKYMGFDYYWRFNDLTFLEDKKSCYLVSYARELVSKEPLADTLEIKLNYSTPPDNPNEFWKTHELGSFFLYKK